MLDAPWPPPHDGPRQPRDAHAAAWADAAPRRGTAAGARRPTDEDRTAGGTGARAADGTAHGTADATADATVWWPADDGAALPRRAHDGVDARASADASWAPPRASGDPLRQRATWLPAPAWIPQPAPAPEQRWTPEQDWVATFVRRAPAERPRTDHPGGAARWLVAGAVAAVVVPLAALALALGL